MIHFTDRETEIIELIACGLSNKEIALRLGIGKKTVESHINNMLGRTGQGNRTSLAVYYLMSECEYPEGFVRKFLDVNTWCSN